MKPSPDFNTAYTVGSLLEVLGLCLLGFSIYLIPHSFFGLLYSLPDAIFEIEWWLNMHRHPDISPTLSRVIVIFLPFFVAGILCFVEARNLTRRIEKQLLGQDELSLAEKTTVHYSESATAIVRVVLAISSVFVIFWLITTLFFS